MKRVLLLAALVLTGCERDLYAEWVTKQDERCFAMRGHLFHDRDAKSVACYRSPIGRMTKTLFTETYQP